MHVAILCEFGTVNGGENSILAMIDELKDVRFTVLAPAAGRLAKRLKAHDVRHVEFIPRAAHESRSDVLARLAELTDSLAPDVLHGNSLSMGRLTGALSPNLSVPTTAHLRDVLRLSRATISDLNGNDRLFAVSHAARTFHGAQGLDLSRTHVLYNGVDGTTFQPGTRTGWLHDELAIPPEAKLIATVGQITLRKGQDVLIQAAARSAATLPNVHWLVVGERYSMKQETVEYHEDLLERVSAAGLDDRVHWLGYRDDVARMLPEVDLLVHPARQEPLGRVLLEAAACAVPIVATAVGGTEEILGPDSAILIRPDDPSALVEAATTLLGDARRSAAMGEKAREAVLARFSIKDRAKELAAHWREL